jgi:hypothetical protein
MSAMKHEKRTYKAIVYDKDKKCFGKRITIEASDVDDAVRKMDYEYGKGNYIDLHNEDATDKSR